MALYILTALAVGIQIGINPLVETLGGIGVTVPTMLFWYVPTGLAEALFTVPIVLSLSQVSPTKLHGLSILYDTKQREKTSSENIGQKPARQLILQ